MEQEMSGKKRNMVRADKERDCIEYTTAKLLSFVLPVAVMLVVFAIKGIYPFGDRSFLCTDLYHQYMPFFCEFMRSIKAGEGISYTWNVGVGSNFLSLYGYYLASPLHWLGLLVPTAHIMEFLTYLVVLKIGLCGLTAFCYLSSRQEIEKREGTALFFACAYALSGFLAAYNWNIMWLDCVILLPLIMMGLERLVYREKCAMYCVTLALSILTNFYISIMICIFLVMYFIFLYATGVHPAARSAVTRRGKIAGHLKPAGLFAFYSLLAAGMAAMLLIPEVCALIKTDFGEMSFPSTAESYFSVLDMLARHCICVSVEKGLDHWPNIYCGAGVFLFLPLYAVNEKIPARKRFGMLAMAGILLLSFSTNFLNFIWHGLNYPDSLPARQSFIYIMLILIMCYDACKNLDFAWEKKNTLIHIYLIAAAALLLVEKFVEHEDFCLGVEWLTLLFVTIYAVVLYLAYLHRGRKWRIILGCFALAAVVAETGINTYATSVSNVNREEYLKNQDDYRQLYEWVKEREDGFYRMEKFSRKTKNDGALAGYPTASVFSSTMNSAVMDLYTRLGMRHSKVYYGYDGATAFVSALLNVNYLYGESSFYENSLYTNIRQSDGIYLYRAENILPFGYVAPKEYDLPSGFTNSGLRLQNQMVHDLGIADLLFTKCEAEKYGDNVRFTAPQDGIYYGIITASGTKKVKAAGALPYEPEFIDLKNGAVLYLGYLEEGKSITLSNSDKEDESKKIAADVYRMDETVLQSAIETLSCRHLDHVEYDSTHLKGTLLLEKEGRLILSVPYENGWKVKLNKEPVSPQLFGETFMAFDLQPGAYELEMHYIPEGAYAGLAVSVLSILCFVGLLFFKRKILD